MENLTLDEILATNDKILLNSYLQAIEDLKTNRLSKKIIEDLIGKSITDIQKAVLYEETINTSKSSNFFGGDLVLLYPDIKEYHTKNYLTCDFSGSLIYPGSLYVYYRPLIENLITGNIYVLKKTIKIEPAYYKYLPTNIEELELLDENIRIENQNADINYSHLSSVTGGSLTLRLIRKGNIR